MWFKNIQIYQFTKPLTLTAEEISTHLEQHEFTPCGSQEPSSSGWVAPLGQSGTDLVHAANGYIMVCRKVQEKLLPASVINEELAEKIIQIEEKESRKVARKERVALKEEITFTLMPVAFARSRTEFAYIAVKEGLLVLNISSEKRADDFLSSLREALGGLPVVPVESRREVIDVLTEWVGKGSTSPDFDVGEDCELRSDMDASSIIRCKNQDLGNSEILGHLKNGMHVASLAVCWNDRLEFVLDEKLTIKRLRFTDMMQEELNQNSDSSDDEAARFDVEFSLMTLEYAAFIKALGKALGGLKKPQTKISESDTVGNADEQANQSKAESELAPA